jgi:hypothetical protein
MTSACSGASLPEAITAQSHTLVTYREEGGFGGAKGALIVSDRGQATATLGRCATRFHLDAVLWKSLKATLKQTNMHAIAGNYPPPPGSADEITYVITVRRDTVRTSAGTNGVIPPPKLKPLLTVLGKTLSAGERRMARSCGSNRITNSTG